MHNLQKYAKECLNELDRLNIPYSPNIISFKPDTKSVRRYGCCHRKARSIRDGREDRENREEEFYITISYILLLESNPVDALKSVLMHEIIHTVDGCFNHGERFTKIAKYVEKELGYIEISGYSSDYSSIGMKDTRRIDRFNNTLKYNRLNKSNKNKSNKSN